MEKEVPVVEIGAAETTPLHLGDCLGGDEARADLDLLNTSQFALRLLLPSLAPGHVNLGPLPPRFTVGATGAGATGSALLHAPPQDMVALPPAEPGAAAAKPSSSSRSRPARARPAARRWWWVTSSRAASTRRTRRRRSSSPSRG